MVAVIAGNGLGLLGTSLQPLGSGLGGKPGLGESGAAQYVNVATGNLVLQGQDASLVAQGFLAGLVRTYNSLGSTGDLGNAGGWLLGLDRRLGAVSGTLDAAGSTLTREGGDGEEETFTFDATRGEYVGVDASGAEDSLRWDAATRTWTYTAGGSRAEETYTAAGQLVALRDGLSGASWSLSYNASGQLVAATAGDGEALVLGYDPQGRVSTLSTLQIPAGGGTAVTERRVGYTYDGLGRLASVTTDLTPDNTTDSSVFTTTYTYDGNSTRIASLTQSDGVVVSYTYAEDAQGHARVATVTTGSAADGAAQTLSFSYDLSHRTTTVADANGRAWVYGYDAHGNLTSVTSPAVNGQYQVTRYTYTADGHLASVTDAQGHTTIYAYDAHGNRVLERDAEGHTTTWTYNADDQVLTRTVYQVADPDGTDPGNAGAASAPSTTWYVYDDGSDGSGSTDQLRYVIDADGDVSETQYNHQGQVSLTRSFAGAAYDTGALTASTAPTLQAMNSWAAAQDLTRTTRVDYTYDVSGRLTSKTDWDQVDSQGKGILDRGRSVTRYVYDAQGLLRQQIATRGADRSVAQTTSYSYDGLGRLIGQTDALGHVTTYAWQAGGTLVVTYANGRVHTEVRNSAGELVTVTESASGQPARTTHYLYDEAGQLRATQDPSGAITYTFYDAAGRISGTVDATGAVTQYTRDADGNVVETRQYASLVDTTNWLSDGALTAATPTAITAIAPAANALDRITLSLYDLAGLHVADVDALGHVTTYGYDGAGNRTVTTQYATALNATQLAALQSAPSWSTLQGDLASVTSAADRITRTFYDVANRAVATLDAAGDVTTTAYDAAGRITKTTAYANRLTAAQLAALGNTPSLSTVLGDIAVSANDQITHNYYDDAGRLIATVDAEGYLTTTTYNESIHAVLTTRYAQALSATQLSNLTGHEALAALLADIAGSTAQTRVQEYDADGELVCSIAVDGTVTTYTYDAAGNLLTTTVRPPAGGQVRQQSASYDGFGDALTATDGAGATTTNVYNARGQQVQSTDALGHSTWSFYDVDGRLVYTVQGIASGPTQNALGEVTAYAYDAFGEVTRTTRYAARLDLTALGLSTTTSLGALTTAVAGIANPAQDATSTTTYTLDGLTASVRDGLGYTTASTYDAFGDLASLQKQLSGAGQALSAGNSTTTTYTYDARGERIGELDDAGGLDRALGVSYDAFGRVTRRIDGNGHVTTYAYDALGRQISLSETVQGTARTTQTTYDAYGRTLSRTDALGQTTLYQYSSDTHTVTVTTPDGVTLTTTKDAYGDTLAVTDSLGNTTRSTYDGDGRLLTTTDPLGHTTAEAYDADGELTRSTDANGIVTAYTYDAAGRVLARTLDPGGLALTTTYAYDGRGQTLSVTDPQGVVTSYAYDADGNTLAMVQDAGSGKLNLTTTYTWDGAGHQLSLTQGAGTAAARTTQYTYDHLGRRIRTQVDPSGLNLTTTYAYGGRDNLVAQTDPDGHLTRYVYNEANEQVYVIDAGGGVTQTWHDADGRLTATRRYLNALSAAQLSALGTTPTYAAVAAQVTPSTDDAVNYTVYNGDGEAAYTIDPRGYVTWTHRDEDGRILEVLAYANAISLTPSLVSALQQGTAYGAVTSAIGQAGNTMQNAQATLNLRDAAGQIRFVVRQDTVNGQLVALITEQRYDAAGRVIAKVVYGDAVAVTTSGWLYDQFSTSGLEQSLAGATHLQLTQYVYDSAGRLRFTLDATNHVVEQQYDAKGQLTQTLTYLNAIAVPASLTAASLTAAINASNTAASTRFTRTTYDAAGRVLETADALGVNARYTYDALGQKIASTNRDGATWTYAYDKAGCLVTQTSPPVAVSGYTSGNTISTANTAIVTEFSYDGNGNVLSKTEAAGTPQARTLSYAYDSRGHQTRITYPDGSYASVTYDALGRAVVDRDVNGHYTYKAYNAAGEPVYDVDGNGYVTAYVYDGYGNPTQVTRYATALSLSLTQAGQPLSWLQIEQAITTSSSDRVLTTTYDQLNRKLSVTQGSVSYVYYTGSPAGQWSSGSPTTVFTYDAYGHLASTSVLLQDAYGSAGQPGYVAPVWATTYAYYDAAGHKTLEVDPSGYVTTWAYDAQGNLTQTTQYARAISTAGLGTTTPPALPAAGDAASGFDRTTTYSYDGIGRKVSETDWGDYSRYVSGTQSLVPDARTTSWTYDGEDRVTAVSVNGATTRTTYDALGRVLSVTQPARSVLVANWQTLLVQNPTWDLSVASLYETASPVTTFTYDALGNALSATTATAGAAGASQVSYSHYDTSGRVIGETDANGTTYTHTYDAAGNLTSTAYALTGNGAAVTVTSSYTYDADNQRLSSVTTRNGATDSAASVQYNAFGEIVAKGDGPAYGGDALSYQYDHAGNLVAATDPKTGATHTYSYRLDGTQLGDAWTITGGGSGAYTAWIVDAAGRHVGRWLPSYTSGVGQNAAAMHQTLDRWGNVVSNTDARGYTTAYEYDSQNHLIKQIEPEVLVTAENGARSWQTPSKAWYYDLNGNALGVTDENGHTTTNTYDAAGDLTATTDAVGVVTRYAYDGLGRQVAKQTPVTATTSHLTFSDVDALGRVIAKGDFLLAGSTRTQSTQQSYALDTNGNRIRVTDALGQTSYYAYDSQGRMLSSQTPDQHAAGLSHTYRYDLNGNKIGETDANGNTQTWTYDAYGRVQAHTDLSGARYTYTYDASSGLLTQETSSWNPASQGQSDPGYVPAANGAGTSSETYSYYADGQVAEVTQKTGSITTTTTAYQYDAAGNETDEDVHTYDGAGGGVDTDTQSQYDSHNRLSEVTETDHGTGVMRTAYNYDAAGNRRAVFVQSGYGGSPINPGSGGPTVTAIGAQTVQPGGAFSLDVAPHFTDTLGFGLTFTATGLPAWMHISSDGVLSTSQAQAAAGSWSIRVTGTDVDGNAVSVTFTVTVPVVNPVFPGFTTPSATTGVGLSFFVPTATDANGSALTYAATYYNGSSWTSVLPSWISFNASTRTFAGTPPAGSAGTYKLAVNAYAANGGAASLVFNLSVAASPPVYHGGLANQTGYATRAFSYTVPAGAFIEIDGSTLTLSAGTYSAGSESALPSWLTFNATTRTFSGTPPQSAVGQTFTLYVKATNPSGQVAEGTFNLGIQPYVQPPPVYHGGLGNQTGVIGGSSLNLPLPAGAFTEPDGGALTYTAYVLVPEHDLSYPVEGGKDIADREIPAAWAPLSKVGLGINATNGTITGVPTTLDYLISTVTHPPTYQHDPSYEIEIVATNGQAETVAGTFTLSNSYKPPAVITPVANPPAQNPRAGWVQILQPNTFSDPYGHGLTYSATLANGAALPSGLTWADSSISIGSVISGSYAIQVTATDPLGRSASLIFTLTINNVAPVFIGPASNHTGVVGAALSITQPGATDANGDALSYVSMLVGPPGQPDVPLPAWLSFNAATLTWTGTPPAAGTWQIVYWAIDGKATPQSMVFTLTVNNAVPQPPVYNGGILAEVDLFVPRGQTRTYTFPSTAFSSPASEALTYTAKLSNGSALPSYLTFNGAARTFTASAAPHDRRAMVTLTATDTQGRSVSDTFLFYVEGCVVSRNAKPAGGRLEAQDTASLDTLAAASTKVTPQATGTPNIQSYWFTYDADNRVEVDGGDRVNGQIQVVARTGSVENAYNQAGEVVTQLSNGGAGYGIQTQTFNYDARGEQIGSTLVGGQVETKQYDADGHLIADVYTYAPGTTVTVKNADGTFHMGIGGWLSMATTYYYNADGEVYATFSYGRPNVNWNAIWNRIDNGRLDPSTEMVIPAAPPTLSAAANGVGYGVLGLQSHVSHWDPTTGTGGYDHEGNAQVYTYSALNSLSQWHTTTYRVSYLKKDGYLEKATSGTSDDPNVLATTDTSLYDAFGRRIAIDTHSAGQPSDQVRAFAYDADGEILERRDGSATGSSFTVNANGGYSVEHYAYVEGQQIGSVDEHGDIDVLSGVTGFSNGDAGSGDYVAQAGDTMQSIAQAVYGDASLWYVVADANGFEAATDTPAAGQTLKLPQVTTNSNTAETFKPYNPREISGSTTPSLPQAPMPAPSAHHCSTLAEIVVIAVVIVASIYTAGLASQSLVYGASSSVWEAGATAMVGGYGGAGIAAAAIGGVAGNLAGQVAGDAEGIHQGVSLGEALDNGVVTGLTAGVGAGLSNAAITGGEAAALQGAAGYASQTLAGKLTGQPTQFSWANLVADALGSAITAKVGLPTHTQLNEGESSGNFFRDLAGGVVNGAIDSETARLLGGDAANGRQIAEDAFGNALGNAAIAGIEEANARSATKPAQAPIEIDPGSPQLQVSDINEPIAPIGPVAYTVQSGDSLSGILGTSDPAAIGAFMRANGLTSSTIYPGEQLVFPSGGYTSGDEALGQATLNIDNQRIAALQASQSYDAYGTGIHWMSAGEQEEMLNVFPNATYGTSSGLANNDDVVGDYINMMNQVGSYAQAAISGGYAGFQAIPGKMDAAVSSVWGDIKSGWAHVTSLNALAGDVLSLNNEISQLPEQLPQLPGEVQSWATGLGNRMEQDGAQLLGYLRNTPGTQITYDAAYTLTSNAPMIALGAATDGLGDVAGGSEAVSATDVATSSMAGLRTSAVISSDRAESFLIENGMSPADAADYVGSFDGPITARLVEPGESFLRYTGNPSSQGDFLAQMQFANPDEAVSSLYLGPYGNPATYVQQVTSVNRSIVLEGGITNGAKGVKQTLIVNRNAFQFGNGGGY